MSNSKEVLILPVERPDESLPVQPTEHSDTPGQTPDLTYDPRIIASEVTPEELRAVADNVLGNDTASPEG